LTKLFTALALTEFDERQLSERAVTHFAVPATAVVDVSGEGRHRPIATRMKSAATAQLT
jgi:hypothetical protein